MTQKQLTAIWFLVLCTLIVVSMVGYVWHEKKAMLQQDPVVVLSFNDCVRAGYSMLESYPRQCKTPDGRTYAEEIPEKITYRNSSSNDIVPELPFPDAVIGKNLTIIGLSLIHI